MLNAIRIKTLTWCATTLLVSAAVVNGAEQVVPVDVTVFRKHQACLADVRGTAGRITAVQLTPSVEGPSDLEGMKVHWYWDGGETPFIVCSLKDLLALFGPDGSPRELPPLTFDAGFRVFLECPRGSGGSVTGRIVYEEGEPPDSSRRLRYDPDLGIVTPQMCDALRRSESGVRLGHGERIPVPNAGFESGRLSPWYDLSWDSADASDRFKVYQTGVEGVAAYGGEFVAGSVRDGNGSAVVRVDGLVPGYRYRLSAAVNTWGTDEGGHTDKAKVRIGINSNSSYILKLHPEEGDLWTIDFSHEPFYFPHCWFARMFAQSQDHWSRISVGARARGEVASLYLQGAQLLPDIRKWCLFDDVTLENVPIPLGSIAGRITDERGKGVKNRLLITDPYGFTAKTHGDGRFVFTDMPEGVYRVRVHDSQPPLEAVGVRVLADQTTELKYNWGDSLSAEIVTREPEAGENLLINAGFEAGDLAGWRRAYECPAMGISEATRRVAPPSGGFMFGGEHVYHHAGTREIVYQQVPVEKGSRWTLRAKLFAHTARSGEPRTACRLVADPSGGTAFSIASEEHTGEWEEVSISFIAESDRVTVGVAMWQATREKAGIPSDLGIVGNIPNAETRTDYEGYYCDDLLLTPADEDAAISSPAEIEPRQTVDSNAAPSLPDAETTTITLPDGRTTMDLIHIPAGRFLMGGDGTTGWAADDEFPRHHVTLDDYWIGKYEVTNAQYKAFCDATGYPYPPDPAFSKVPWVHRDRRYHYGDYLTGMPDYPVVNVTWHDARAFCKWAGLRLPTEAEWEMAARGHGDSLRTYPWGEQTDPTWATRVRDNLSIQKPDGNLYTCEVDKFAEHHTPYKVGDSAFGVAGMGGNVREWCADWYGPYRNQASNDPTGPATGTQKVLRGGCWRGRDYGVMTRCSYRHQHDPDYFEWGTTGFRVAADPR